MSDRLPISVFIIAKNEADRIGRAIESVVGWVDEVLVVDSGSTDETIAISETLGARTLYNEWDGYGQQKIFSQAACKNDWILNLDADEVISDDLKREIEAVFTEGIPSVVAFNMHWQLVMFNEEVPKKMAPVSDFIRLYDRRKVGFRDSPVHDSVVIGDVEPEKLGELKNYVFHKSFRSLQHMKEKLESYSTQQAEDMLKRGRCPSSLRLPFEYPFAFFKSLFLRNYWIYGSNGVKASRIYAEGRRMRLTKTLVLFRNKKPENKGEA